MSTLTPDCLQSTPPQTLPWRLLRRVLPAAMLIVLLLGLGGGVRLALYLGQPIPGFALMWRKEIKMLAVSWTTPSHWAAVATGKVNINDRILCISGYQPSPDSAIYGLEPRYAAARCENGSRHYAQIFRERFASDNPTVELLIDRQGTLSTVTGVPLVRFTLLMLLDTFLPVFILGLGALVVGSVAYRANPKSESNLVFCLFTTLAAMLVMNQAYSGRFSDLYADIADGRAIPLIMVAPWMPFIGVVSFHLVSLLTDQPGFTAFARRSLRPYYTVSLCFSALGVFLYTGIAETTTILPNWLYNYFTLGSSLFAWGWGAVCMARTATRTPSRRVRHQAVLFLASLILLTVLVIPPALYVFTDLPALRRIYAIPYLALAFIGLLAYAILRYQLFRAKNNILITLLLAVSCILIANGVYLTIGRASAFLPILITALITAAILEARRGPTAFFNKLLHRETLDYRAVAHFGEQVGGLQQIESLIRAAWSCLNGDLEVERLDIWLVNEERQELHHFTDGRLDASSVMPPGFVEQLAQQPNPVRVGQPAAQAYAGWLAAAGVTLWAPLEDRGQAVGVMGLGPRWTGELYDERDVQLIGILARRLALSILNTRQLERLQTASRLVLQAEENERRKIAHEIHDTVLQFLLVLTYGLDELRERHAALATEIERWQDRISTEASQLRELLNYLRAPELLIQRGLIPSLRSWLDQARPETPMTITAALADEVEPLLGTEGKLAIYRICREATHNAMKHSLGGRISVRLSREEGFVRIAIADDGQGFDVAQALESKGKGYSSLQDLFIYIESVGGRLEVRSAAGRGTTITGWAPIKTDSMPGA